MKLAFLIVAILFFAVASLIALGLGAFKYEAALIPLGLTAFACSFLPWRS